MKPKFMNKLDAVGYIRPGMRVLVGTVSGESTLLAEAVMDAGDDCSATYTGVFVPGLNRHTYLAGKDSRVETYFMTEALRRAGDRVDFIPLCYQEIAARLRQAPPDAALMMLAPPEEDGLCGWGVACDFMADLWSDIPIRIAHINSALPRTKGFAGIPYDELTVVVEQAAPITGSGVRTSGSTPDAIGRAVAPFVPDGATLQTGLGKVPEAILGALSEHRGLKVHSGLIGDAVLDLIEAGALANGTPITAGVAIGSDALYAACAGDAFAFQPVSVTHNPLIIAAIPNFIAINSAFEVDLFGQSYAEQVAGVPLSGPGGASDFARAARLSEGGLRVVALQAQSRDGSTSRIVPAGRGSGPVSLSRFDTDVIATEFGAADLRGKSMEERAMALIAVAAPDHRDMLFDSWRKTSER